jgi:uncharacterized membrane protein SpoIIM required for sporulation
VLKTFLESRLGKWKRLEELTARVSRLRLKNLSGEEVREFGQLYRRTASDLAIAREEVSDQRLVNYLNFRYTLTAFVVFVLAAVFASTASLLDEDFADRVAPGMKHKIASHDNWTEDINNANPLASTSIQSNNITVTFFAFAGGVLAGIGTLWVLVQNGMLLGMVMSLCFRYRFWDVPIFVSAHGVIELTAIFIAGGAGLLIGKALLMPGDLRRIDALVENGRLAIKLILGCIPMLLIAGLIEGFISPAHIPAAFKFSVSAMSALLMVMYFLKRDERASVQAING